MKKILFVLVIGIFLSSCYVTRDSQLCQKHHKYHKRVEFREIDSETATGWTLILVPGFFIVRHMIRGN